MNINSGSQMSLNPIYNSRTLKGIFLFQMECTYLERLGMWAHACVYTSTLVAQLSLLIQLVSHFFSCKKKDLFWDPL